MNTMLMRLTQLVLMVTLATTSAIVVIKVLGLPSVSINQISTNKQSTFDVTGESKITTIPDQAEVRLGFTINSPTVKQAQDQANSTINAINAELQKLGIEKADIKTEAYSLYPNYDYSTGNGQRIIGYSVNTSLVVTMTDFAQLNQAIDAATAAGANQIGGISFTLSDEKKAEVEKQARQEAIDDAQAKAKELAGLAGMRLGKIVNIYEMPAMDGQLYPMAESALMNRAMGDAGGAPTNVEPGSTSYSFSVTLSYETL